MAAPAGGAGAAVVVAVVIRLLLVIAILAVGYHLAVVLAWEALKGWWRAPKVFVQRTELCECGSVVRAAHGQVSGADDVPEPHARGPPYA